VETVHKRADNKKKSNIQYETSSRKCQIITYEQHLGQDGEWNRQTTTKHSSIKNKTDKNNGTGTQMEHRQREVAKGNSLKSVLAAGRNYHPSIE
jgi:hypothetical protein